MLIVPWYALEMRCRKYETHCFLRPVIESREFYQLFPELKKCLDQQVTHQAAGEFLHVMKTLMAKLKVRQQSLEITVLTVH